MVGGLELGLLRSRHSPNCTFHSVTAVLSLSLWDLSSQNLSLHPAVSYLTLRSLTSSSALGLLLVAHHLIPQSSHTGPSLATLQLFPLPNSRCTPSSSSRGPYCLILFLCSCDQSIKFLHCEPRVHGCCPMAVLDCLLSVSCHDPHSSRPDLGSPWALFMFIRLLEMPLCPTACLLKGPALSSLCVVSRSSPMLFCGPTALGVSLLALTTLAGVAAANCVLCCLPLDCELLVGRDHMVTLYLLWHLTVPCTW